MSTRYATVFPAPFGERTIEANQHSRTANRSKRSRLACADSGPGSTVSTIRRPLNERQATPFRREVVRSCVKARDLMQACAATLRPEDSIERAARLISDSHSGSVPVVDGAGRLIGLITDRDITVKLVALGASVPHAQVSDCMSVEAFACSADSSLISCVSAMSWHEVRRIPIVDDEHRLLGTISLSDLACYLCEHPEDVGRSAMADILWALAY